MGIQNWHHYLDGVKFTVLTDKSGGNPGALFVRNDDWLTDPALSEGRLHNVAACDGETAVRVRGNDDRSPNV